MAVLRWPSLILIISLQVAQIFASNSSIPAILVFGDSTSDPGNNNYIATVLKSDFPPYGRDFIGHQPTGRFCNGRLSTDFIAEGLGVKESVPAYLDPDLTPQDLVTGVSFASAGTGYDNLTASILNVLPMWEEIENFKEYKIRLKQILGEPKASNVLREALYLISTGTNDFIENYLQIPTRRLRFSASEYVDFIIGLAVDLVKELHDLGARRILLAGIPPMGCMPLLRTMNVLQFGHCMEEFNEISVIYNTRLQAAIGDLRRTLPDIKIAYGDTYTILDEAIRNPSKYGFIEVAKACCGTGRLELGYLCNILTPTCTDASTYVFWDSVHPTEKLYEVVANSLLENSIPTLL